jgi:ATP synthase protein I
VKYEALKRELMLTTSGFAGAGIVISYFMSGVDTAASFAIGSLGAVVYLRLLGRKVDSKGPADGSGPDEQSEGGGGGGAAAPTLLVPAILFMIYNRWNALAAPQMEHYASLLPILLGFFSYKPSTLVRAYRDLTDDEEESPRSSSDREREENAREDEKQVTT